MSYVAAGWIHGGKSFPQFFSTLLDACPQTTVHYRFINVRFLVQS